MNESNEARAAAARGPEPAAERESRASPPDAAARSKTDTVQRFAQRTLGAELAALAAHMPELPALPDTTAVHQLRIAARRMRVWLRMFRPLLAAADARRLSSELGWFARELGTVRDLDVYADRLPSYVAAAAGIAPEDLGGYELYLRRARSQARAALGGVFTEARFTALGEELAAVSAALARHSIPEPGTQPLTEFARRRLRKAVKRLRKHGRAVGSDAPADELHRLRIEAKRLRYELEFFASAYPSLTPAAKTVKRMQDLLGELQDACVASENLERYALGVERPLDRRQAFALGRLMQAQVDRATDVRRRFPAAWRDFDKELKSVKKAFSALG